MKIIAVIGSPKGRGSGFAVVRRIEDRMKAQGSVEFQYLFLKDANLEPCTGCYACMAFGEDKCPLKDDRGAIERMLLDADGVILSSPVHVANVSGLMKNFIDRFAYRNHRPIFFRQKVMTVVNMAGSDRASLRYILGGSRIVQELAVQTPPWPQTEQAVAAKERAIAKASDAFYRACLDTALPTPTLSRYVTFLMMRRLSRDCQRYLPADHAYYDTKDYYYDARISPGKKIVATAFSRVLSLMMRRMGPGPVSWPHETNRLEKVRWTPSHSR